MDERLKQKQWKAPGANVIEALNALDAPGPLEGGAEDFLNPAAEDRVGNGGLAKYQWTLTESIIVPGSEVTVVGIYHASPARIDLKRKGLNVSNGLRPGSAEVVAGKNLKTQWIGVAAFAAIALLSHVFVYKWLGTILKMNSAD